MSDTTSNVQERGGQAGGWNVEHEGNLVILKFTRADGLATFHAVLGPGTAIDLAQALVKHAMRAGHGEPVTLTIGG